MKTIFKSNFKIFSVMILVLLTVFSFNVKAKNDDTHRIPIAMATDNNYVYPTVVAMTSMLENKNDDTYLDFHIMISGEVDKDNKERIKLLANLYQNCSVKLIDMKDKFKTIYTSTSRLTAPTYYRLELPSLMSEYDKIIYLDGDIIVRKDLWEMYSTDIKDNYIAGTKDFGQITWGKGYAKRMGIKDLNQYVNAGILLMNLKKMREDDVESKFNKLIPELKPRNLCLNDQDIINITCYNKIALLSPQYNAMQHFGFNFDNLPTLIDCYDMQEWKKACLNPIIIHYTSSHKPWKGYKERFYNEWDKYRKIAEAKLYGSPIIKNGVYTISSALNNNKVLDIAQGSQYSGANLQLWTSNKSNAQKFKFTYKGEGYYEIQAVCSERSLDVEGAQKNCGTNVWQYEKNNTDAQKWLIKNAGNGYYYIISKCNELYLDVQGAKTANGTNIQVWKFNGSDAQKFRIKK